MAQNFTGQTIDHYELVERIGVGGMAAVYRAQQTNIDRQVAVKIMLSVLAHDPGFALRFEREANTIARLEHPHILPIHDYGHTDDFIYLVTRLMPGGSLDQQIIKGPMTLDEVTKVLQQLSGALHYAHQSGVIHRDLKPSNVLLDEFGNVYLTDFGIAKMMEVTSITQSGAALGTPAYMAPEQWRGEEVDARTDIYALGVMLYQMLSGELPFMAPSTPSMMYLHLEEQPPSLLEKMTSLPRGIESVIRKAMAKMRADRFSSTLQLVKAFEDAVVGLDASQTIEAIKAPVDAEVTAKAGFAMPPSTSAKVPASNRMPDTPTSILPTGSGGQQTPPSMRQSRGRGPWIVSAALAIIAVITIALAAMSSNSANQQAAETVEAIAQQMQNLQTEQAAAVLNANETVTAIALLPTNTARPTYTPLPPNAALPTYTPLPSYTPLATNTALPTYTPLPPNAALPTYTLPPTYTALPTYTSLPPNTALPTYTPLPTDAALPTYTPPPTYTARPALAALPTYTPLPMYTALPTYTSRPPNTALPTYTPLPTNVALPTYTPLPTYTVPPSYTPLPTYTSPPSPDPGERLTRTAEAGEPVIAPSITPVPSNTPTLTPTVTIPPTETPASIAYRTPAPGQSPPYLDEFRVPMVFMPSGVFTLGFAQGEVDERPEHEVSISAYYLDMYEVTNAAYDACVTARFCDPPTNALVFEDPSLVEHPVVFVTWEQAQTYCEWRGGRLPTEAEWEMAARYAPQSGMTSTRPWGSSGATSRLANFSSEMTMPVGSYPDGASAIGAHDMAGNVFEWVLDWYSVDYYARSPFENPTGPVSGDDRVIRGGAWFYDEYYTRSANRDFSSPVQGRGYIGFRCALPVIGAE